MPDELPALIRDRQILVEALRQVVYLSRAYQAAELDPGPFLEQAKRIGERLIAVQNRIEELDLD